MKQTLLLFLFSFFSFSLFGQVSGTVTDNNSNALATVNIYIENSFIGTTTNDEGTYELNISAPGDYTIIFKYLGFKTVRQNVSISEFPYNLEVVLVEEEVTLSEVIINTNENPANRIIRATIDNRKAMLNKINAFTAKFYSRGLIRIKNAPEKILGQDIGDLGGGLDSTRSGIIYLSETISNLKFERPDNLKETITASKVSGNDNGFSFNTAMDVDYNFYNNTIEIGNQIVSPIADYAFNYYRYQIEGAFYDDLGNLINKVKVIPKRENDRVFSGTIYIVEDQWSIYALTLDITGEQAQIPAAELITIEQNFNYSKADKLWVLLSQSIDFSYGIFGINGDGRFTAVYSDYNFNPEFTKASFSNEVLSFAEEANKKDSTYWQIKRPVPLTFEEATDYEKKDSIQVVRKSKTYLDSIDSMNNKFKLLNILTGYTHENSYEDRTWSISSPLQGINFNTVQGFYNKMTFNFRKNYDEFRQYLNTNLNFGYGFSDERFRIDGSVTYKFNNITRPFITLSGGVKTEQFNNSEPISPFINTISSLFFQDNYLKIYERRFAQLSYNEEWFNGFRFYGTASYERRVPLFNTTDQTFFPNDDKMYTSNNPIDPNAYGVAPFDAHTILKLHITTRIRFGQKYFSYPKSRFSIPNNDFPTLFLSYEKGLAASKSKYNFDQLKIRLAQGFDIGNKGTFQYNARAGVFINADDIAFMDFQHFNGNQTSVSTTFASYLNVFNNLPYYSLSTNQSYLEVHAEHDFKGFILGKLPLINKLNYNLVVGAHALSTEGNSPYYEFTIGIDNIGFKNFRLLRFDYVRSYQNGFQSDAVVFGLKFLDIID